MFLQKCKGCTTAFIELIPVSHKFFELFSGIYTVKVHWIKLIGKFQLRSVAFPSSNSEMHHNLESQIV